MPPPPADALQHGSLHEIDLIGTLVGKFLPVYSPQLKYVEEGCECLLHEGKTILVSSSDGSLRSHPDDVAHFAIEGKCPLPGKQFAPDVHYELPTYYVPQLLAEMRSLCCQKALFISYGCVVIEIHFQTE